MVKSNILNPPFVGFIYLFGKLYFKGKEKFQKTPKASRSMG
jgi:hypothetical protein